MHDSKSSDDIRSFNSSHDVAAIERKQAEQATRSASQYARSLLEARLDPLVTISAAGKITDVLYNASLYRDSNENVLGVFAAARDITESKRLGQALESRNWELEAATVVAEKANLAKSNFLSSMSHELRTPLNAILGFAQLIETDPLPPTQSQKRSLDQILSAGWFLLELVNEILDLAQIESGVAVMTLESVPLENIMSECRELVEPLAHKCGIKVSFPDMERIHWVDADRTRIRQVLINLLHNAIKYNKLGGMVTMSCTLVPKNAVRISIRDTGPGLSPAELGRENGAEQGSDIGLVVVKRWVELMGGVIGVESQVDVGSIFWIELKLTA